MEQKAKQRTFPVWVAMVAFLVLHAASIMLFRTRASLLSCVFLTAAVVGAGLASFWRARRSSPGLQRFWNLVGGGLLLWALASVVSACEEFLFAIPTNVGAGSQIFYFLYGAPLLLAICSPPENVWGRSFVWLDGLQICLLGFLTYVTIFGVVPFSHQAIQPVSGATVVSTFNVENLVLAVLAMLRLAAASPEREQRRSFQTLAIFLATYAGAAAVYNHLALSTNGSLGLYDVVIELPYLLLIGAVLQPLRGEHTLRSFPHAKAIGLVLDNAGPALLPTAVLALSILVAREHYRTGIGCVAAALLLYGARSSMLQIQFQRGQAEATRARDSMEVLSLTDPLTGVPNRRRFDHLLASERGRTVEHRQPLSLLLIDIDHFKLLNDRFGHSDGDICLRQVAHALQASLRRESDSLCRYGGEEFAALLPGTDRLGAEIVANRMRSTIRSLRLRTETPLGTFVTVSIGITTTPEHAGTSDEALIRAADRALYRAKQRGRDRSEHEVMDAATERGAAASPGGPMTGAGALVLVQ